MRGNIYEKQTNISEKKKMWWYMGVGEPNLCVTHNVCWLFSHAIGLSYRIYIICVFELCVCVWVCVQCMTERYRQVVMMINILVLYINCTPTRLLLNIIIIIIFFFFSLFSVLWWCGCMNVIKLDLSFCSLRHIEYIFGSNLYGRIFEI